MVYREFLEVIETINATYIEVFSAATAVITVDLTEYPSNVL